MKGDDGMTDLSGKVALITGASRGIGHETALRLSRAGAAVVAVARGEDAIHDLSREIEAAGGRAMAIPGDVADYEGMAAAVARAQEKFGQIDILINNAGVIDPIGHFVESDPAAWADNIRINLVGAYNAARTVVPAMAAAGEGVIVNVSSGAAGSALEGWSAYCAAKAGLAMLTQSLAQELAGSGIRVFGFRPGTVDTVMQEKIRASGINEVSRMRPDDHGPAADPASVMVWLCGPDAAPWAGRELSVRDPELRRLAGLVG